MMNDSDRQTVQTAIDEVIVKVSEEQWDRLAGDECDPRSRTCATQAIYTALESLDELKRGGIPNYNDEWVALFYLTWYQPKQINLAYSVLTGISSNLESENKPLWIRDGSKVENGKFYYIDFGCGCLATMFAVAIAAADSITHGKFISRIVIECIDNSSAMIDLGEKTWGKFVSYMKEMNPNHPVCRILDGLLIRYNTHTNLDLYDLESLPEDTLCLVTAFHCAYEDTLELVRSDLGSLISKYNPDGVVLTTQTFKNEDEMLRKCLPSTTLENYVNVPINDIIKPCLGGVSERVTEWRRNLLRGLSKIPRDVTRSTTSGLSHNHYLSNTVEWNYKGATSQLYSSDNSLSFDNSEIEYREFLRYREKNWRMFDEYH